MHACNVPGVNQYSGATHLTLILEGEGFISGFRVIPSQSYRSEWSQWDLLVYNKLHYSIRIRDSTIIAEAIILASETVFAYAYFHLS